MNKQQQNIKTYVSAWNEIEEGKRKQILADCVTPDISYCDPFTDTIQGLEALVGVMAGVSQRFSGVVHELVDEPATHHNFGYYRWSARLDSNREIPGTDYIEFAPDGRIARVVSFTNMSDWQQLRQ